MSDQTYLSQNEVSEYCKTKGLRLSPKTLEKKRSIGGGPKFYKFGNRVVYSIKDIDIWLKDQLGAPISHAGAGQ